MKTIFVSIASFCDSEIIHTINDSLKRATHPERIHFGVFLQDKEENKDILNHIPNCKVLFCNYKETFGPGWARNKICKELFDNEDYFLQIDSHSRFLQNWDSLLIDKFSKLDGKVCLTGFPLPYYPHESYEEYTSKTQNTNSVISSINKNSYLIKTDIKSTFDEEFKETISISAAFLFSDSLFVKSIIYDDFQNFWDQEVISCLGYINGYTFYSLKQCFVFHQYNDMPDRYKRVVYGDVKNITINDEFINNFKDLNGERTFDDWVNRINKDIKSQRKYISFDPWFGGFSNIRQNYETIAAISKITNRTIILPPKIYCLFFNEIGDKDNYIDMFDALDKKAFTSEFDCVDYYEIPEYKSLEDKTGYFNGVELIAKLIEFPLDTNHTTKDPLDRFVLHCNAKKNTEFTLFSNGRIDIDLNVDDKFIHFPNNLFSQFYYHIYSDGFDSRNKIRNSIKNGVKFKQKFYDLADVVKSKLGNYNAIHIRRNDFLKVHHRTEEQLHYLLNNIKGVFKAEIPLYIATDEKDKTLFYFLREEYFHNIYFLDKFHKDISEFDAMIVEQIICANADVFYGSDLSTFTHYIHVMRGYMGKDDYHRIGTNYNYGDLNYNCFPWMDEQWEWGKIFDLYWKDEHYKDFDNIGIFNLGLYGSHNSALAISKNDEVLEVVELERWVGLKNAGLHFYFVVVPENPTKILKEILNYFQKKYSAYVYNTVYHNTIDENHLKLIKRHKSIKVLHHEAHAANVFYQSPYNKALIISFDGGSEEGFFNIYLAERGNPFEKLYWGNKDLAVAYQTTAHYISEIKEEEVHIGNLVYSGKIMGLSSYGKLDDDMIKKYRVFYNMTLSGDIPHTHNNFKKIFGISDGHKFDEEVGRNMVMCNQFVFEELFNKEVTPFIDLYVNDDRPLLFSGGGAMNILNNTKYDAFVSPNCDDRGLALGCLLWGIKPTEQLDATYIASEPYDELPEHEPYSIEQTLDGLIDGKIFGLIQGRGEHGARALGNRSIICLPKKGMKEILNDKVKHREPFRPFAPVCTLEDAPTYFEFGKYSRWMTHNAKVKEGFEEELGAIIHIDGTARLQTVTKNQNEYMYNLLVGLKERGLPPVLLNTSFNIQGKPILNTYKEALWMRDNTGLDEVITDKFILK